MPCYELGQEYSENNCVEMNQYDFCKGPILFYTDGLGPCIGVCIAWQDWAGIAHLGSHDEHDQLPKFIAEVKEFLPPNVVSQIRPIICGGDPEQYPGDILESRKVVVEVVEKARFGKPNVR